LALVTGSRDGPEIGAPGSWRGQKHLLWNQRFGSVVDGSHQIDDPDFEW
jgi:hypothetical protein